MIGIKFANVLPLDLVHYLVFPLCFLTLNYAFIKLILYIIAYYNSLIIFYDFKIFVLKATFLATDFVEVIDLAKITKFDTYVKGVIPNIIGFGTLVIEQQRDKVRELGFVPDSHRAVKILTKAKKQLIEYSGFNN